LDKKKFLLN